MRRLGLFIDRFFFAIAVILLREAVFALSTFLLRATGVGISQKVMSERGTASSRDRLLTLSESLQLTELEGGTHWVSSCVHLL